MSKDITLFEHEYLSIKQCIDTPYIYAERLGRDSVAFVLIDENKDKKYGLLKEYKPPVGNFIIGAFGGSLDKDISIPEIVIEEVEEESGFEVIIDDLDYVGKRFVSTQMNQFCHLFLVDVTHSKFVGKNPQTELEALSEVVWLSKEEILTTQFLDWKAQVILADYIIS